MTDLSDTLNDFDFSLRMNNAATNDPCAVCGERTDPVVGVELFYSTPGKAPGLVCNGCGQRHAPVLWGWRNAASAIPYANECVADRRDMSFRCMVEQGRALPEIDPNDEISF
jgi:hypothetical protein